MIAVQSARSQNLMVPMELDTICP